MARNLPGRVVSGLLLYAETGESLLNYNYMMSGNRISAWSIDLSADFSRIKGRLNEIAEKFLLGRRLEGLFIL
ncbi:MAG: hypothetical protein K2H64_09010 [Desulfovibrio sp.]|nr:hypothetical protein [Desulfovibrio sp.]